MIRLNLGAGNPGERSWHPIDGWTNRDPALDGWRFEDGLGEYSDGSVSALSISHSLMYVALNDWPRVFAEFARVLCDDGVVRVTEDDTTDTRSRTHPHGWQGSNPAVTLTGPEMVKSYMVAAGLVAADCDAEHSNSSERAIMQDQHGGAPHCLFVEGIRRTRVLFAPHSDDETLFAAFTILKYRPHVVICFPSAGDYGATDRRLDETREAMNVLGGRMIIQWSTRLAIDLVPQMQKIADKFRPSLVFAPGHQCSHPDHQAVASAALEVFGSARLRQYQTYDAAGKVRAGCAVDYEPAWVHQKLRALCRYPSQATHPRAHLFFMDDLREWMVE